MQKRTTRSIAKRNSRTRRRLMHIPRNRRTKRHRVRKIGRKRSRGGELSVAQHVDYYQSLLTGEPVTLDEIRPILEATNKLYQAEVKKDPFILLHLTFEINTKVNIVGRVHGDLLSLRKHLIRIDIPSETNRVVFLGDIAGWEDALSCLLLVFLYKLIYPDFVTILRGPTECYTRADLEGADPHLQLLNNIFVNLPICAIINKDIFCTCGCCCDTPIGMVDACCIECRTVPDRARIANIIQEMETELKSTKSFLKDGIDILRGIRRPINGTTLIDDPILVDLVGAKYSIEEAVDRYALFKQKKVSSHLVGKEAIERWLQDNDLKIFVNANYENANKKMKVVVQENLDKLRCVTVFSSSQYSQQVGFLEIKIQENGYQCNVRSVQTPKTGWRRFLPRLLYKNR